MDSNRVGRWRPLFLPWLAVALGVSGAVGLWFGFGNEDRVQILAGIALLATSANVAIVWQSQARAARRWRAALDAYATREIAREQRRHVPIKKPAISSRAGVL